MRRSLVLALAALLLPTGCARAHTREERGVTFTVGGSGGRGTSAYLALEGDRAFFVDREAGAARVVDLADPSMRARTLAAADAYVYPWVASERGAFYWLAVRGGLAVVGARADRPAHLVAQGDVGPVGLAVDDGRVYFGRQSQREGRIDLLEIDPATGRERTLTDCSGVLGIALDEDTLFATTCRASGGVWRIPRAGGHPVPIAASTFCPITIALDDTRVFYVDAFGDDAGGFAVMAVPKEGGTPHRLTHTDGLAFAVHEGSVFAFDGGALVEIPLDGAPRRVRVPHVEGGVGVAADASHLFYTATDGGHDLALHALDR
jgi:hypothetical protein